MIRPPRFVAASALFLAALSAASTQQAATVATSGITVLAAGVHVRSQ